MLWALEFSVNQLIFGPNISISKQNTKTKTKTILGFDKIELNLVSDDIETKNKSGHGLH